jgi:hypothetical protein
MEVDGRHAKELMRWYKGCIRGYKADCVYKDKYKSIFCVTFISNNDDKTIIELARVSTLGYGAKMTIDFSDESNWENQIGLMRKLTEVSKWHV